MLEVQKHYRFIVSLKTFFIDDNYIYALSSYELAVAPFTNTPVSAHIKCNRFISMVATDTFLWLVDADSIYRANKDLSDIDAPTLHMKYTGIAVVSSWNNILVVSTHSTIFVGTEEYHVDKKYGIISDIKPYETLYISTEAGIIFSLPHMHVVADVKKSIIKFTKYKDALYILTLSIDTFYIEKISIGEKKELAVSEFPLDVHPYDSVIIVHFKYAMAIFTLDLIPVETISYDLEIVKVIVSNKRLFIGFAHGLIEEVIPKLKL